MPDDLDFVHRSVSEHLGDTGSIRRLFFRDLMVDARIGVYDSEKQGTQRVKIDVDLFLRTPIHQIEDHIDNVLDYNYVWNGIHDILAEGHVNLQETLVERILTHCLQPDLVMAARVSTTKLEAYGDCGVGYELARVKQPGF